jgi:hypothetical protein
MNGEDKTLTLFRPVGLIELGLIFDSGMKEFPPRLPEQPIFYPVLNQAYARQIAKDWNATSAQSGFAGFVTKFEIPSDYAASFPVKTVGASVHQELWVIAEQLQEFNSRIVGHIQTVEAYFNENFIGTIPDQFMLKGKNAVEQFVSLAAIIDYSGMDFICETNANAKAIYLNYPFWITHDFSESGVSEPKKQKVLKAILEIWPKRLASVSPCSGPI